MLTFERISTVVLVLAAAAVAATAVHREFGSSPNRGGRQASSGPPERVAEWTHVSSIGISDGPADAPVHVVELADLECPFCKRFHETLKLAKEQFPDRLKVTWIHHPLNGHRFARPAARAAECAHAAGRFQQFVAAVFAKQDSLGLKSWGEYAADAGVEELTVFRACAADTIRVARVEEGLRFGTAIGLRGTPTVLINGWKYQTPPSDSLLFRTIRAVLEGGNPLRAFEREQ